MVRFGEVIYDTVDVRLDVLRALDVEMPVRTDMQRVGDAEVVPEKLVERRVFVDPDDLIGTMALPYTEVSMKKCSVINISSVASCGSVASSSSACSKSFFGLPNSARSWHAGERIGKQI